MLHFTVTAEVIRTLNVVFQNQFCMCFKLLQLPQCFKLIMYIIYIIHIYNIHYTYIFEDRTTFLITREQIFYSWHYKICFSTFQLLAHFLEEVTTRNMKTYFFVGWLCGSFLLAIESLVFGLSCAACFPIIFSSRNFSRLIIFEENKLEIALELIVKSLHIQAIRSACILKLRNLSIALCVWPIHCSNKNWSIALFFA